MALGGYPLTVGIAGASHGDSQLGPALGSSFNDMLLAVAGAYLFLAPFFIVAWLASRVSTDDLHLRWNRPLRLFGLGIGYAVGIQILFRVVALVILAGAVVVTLATRGGTVSPDGIQEIITELVQRFRPEAENLVDTEAIVSNPLYLIGTITLVSFLMAGFTEEVWRAGMFAGFRGAFPRAFETVRGKVLFVVITATIFGLGHTTQGAGAVVLTGVIGLCLGAILLAHRSTWLAVLAHGFFNAMSFLTLYYVQSNPELLKQVDQLLKQ